MLSLIQIQYNIYLYAEKIDVGVFLYTLSRYHLFADCVDVWKLYL